MAKKAAKGITRKRRITAAEAERLNKIRDKRKLDFPPDPNRPRR